MSIDILPGILPMSEEFRDYLHDETKTVGSAESISFPTSEEEICATLRHFSQKGVRVTVQGNRTGLTAASVPGGGHILSLDRMCRVTGLRVTDGAAYLRVQPGLSLSALRTQIASGFDTAGWDADSLAAYAVYRKLPRQYFPPDPTESSASLGGMAACNSSGAKTYHYGPTRPYINGLRVALADGDVIALRRGEKKAQGRAFSLTTLGGRTIRGRIPGYTMPRCKNASGYYAEDDMDLVDLFVGSDGTLGVITELELRLIPQPRVIWGVNSFFKTEEQAVSFVENIRPLTSAAAIEFFDGNALDIVRAHADGGRPVPEGFACMIYTELHTDTDEEAYAAIRVLGKAMEEAGGDPAHTWAAHSLPDRERLLELRHAVPESVNALIAERKRSIPTLAKVGSDMAVPDGHFREIMAMYHRDLEAEGFQFAMWGHIGNNHIHVNVLPRSAEEMTRGKAMFVRWAEKVVALGGTVSAEHGAGKNKANLLPILYGEAGVREMAALKRCFDPGCLLGAGNLFPIEYV
ncbi:MAG: FAD-binding oxidoreductase [Oscillospiraceae bacterium]